MALFSAQFDTSPPASHWDISSLLFHENLMKLREFSRKIWKNLIKSSIYIIFGCFSAFLDWWCLKWCWCKTLIPWFELLSSAPTWDQLEIETFHPSKLDLDPKLMNVLCGRWRAGLSEVCRLDTWTPYKPAAPNTAHSLPPPGSLTLKVILICGTSDSFWYGLFVTRLWTRASRYFLGSLLQKYEWGYNTTTAPRISKPWTAEWIQWWQDLCFLL